MEYTINAGTGNVGLSLSIVENFFCSHSLNESKEMLKEIKEQLFTKSYAYDKASIAHDNTAYFFEKLEELLDAAYLLNQK